MASIYRMISVALAIILILTSALMFFPHDSVSASPGTIYVNGTTGNDSYDGSSPVVVSGTIGPKQTVQGGIDVVSGSGTVFVAAGTYDPSSTIDINKSLILVGAGQATTIFDGTALSSPSAVLQIGTGLIVVMSGITVQHGGDCGLFIAGGEPGSNVTINDCAFINNTALEAGGGVGISTYNTVTMNRCTISSNTISTGVKNGLLHSSGDSLAPSLLGSGGGIFADNSTLTLNSCTVNNNAAMGTGNSSTGLGGGIAAVDNTTLNMDGCTVNANIAYGMGGGLCYVQDIFDDTMTAVPTVNNCEFNQNLSGLSGGAAFFGDPSVFNNDNASLIDTAKGLLNGTGNRTGAGVLSSKFKLGERAKEGLIPTSGIPIMNNCNIVNNQAGIIGGGVGEADAEILLNGCNISGNAADIFGGGIGGIWAIDEIINCTISGNTLTYPNPPSGFGPESATVKSGGFPKTIRSAGLPTVTNAGGGLGFILGAIYLDCATVTRNSTSLSDNESYGGGIYLDDNSGSWFINTIVANNTAYQTSYNNCLNESEIVFEESNIDSQNSCGFTDPTDQVNTDPLLGPLQNNGGPTQTCAITDSSPAFDRGSNDPDFMPPTDQRGITRPQGAYCDIGAYELVLVKSQTTTPVTGPGGTVTFTTGSGGISGLTALPVDACGALGAPVDLPYGIFSFNIVGIVHGSTVPVTVNLPTPIAGAVQYWKCGGAAGWTDVTSLVSYVPGTTTLTLNLTDGGLGDADHLANGRIVDPGGPAFLWTGTPHSSSPYTGPSQQPMPVPNLLVQSASLSVEKVDSGMPVTVTAMVANRGSADGNMRLGLYVNSQEEASQIVAVPKGSRVPVKFTVIKDEPGTYTVYVGGVTAGSFTVNNWVNPDKILFISSGLLFCALVIGIYMLWRKQRYS